MLGITDQTAGNNCTVHVHCMWLPIWRIKLYIYDPQFTLYRMFDWPHLLAHHCTIRTLIINDNWAQNRIFRGNNAVFSRNQFWQKTAIPVSICKSTALIMYLYLYMLCERIVLENLSHISLCCYVSVNIKCFCTRVQINNTVFIMLTQHMKTIF